MFEYIKGTLSSSTSHTAIVDVQGIGYLIYIPLSTFTALPQIKKPISLYISAVIKEDSHRLFGFLTLTERDLFNRAKEISGIGPKTALSLVGHMESQDFQMAILNENIPLISKIPGIGKKTAERLIVELRDNLKKSPLEATSDKPLCSPAMQDAIMALTNLGYNPTQAQKAIKNAMKDRTDEPPLSQLIKLALAST